MNEIAIVINYLVARVILFFSVWLAWENLELLIWHILNQPLLIIPPNFYLNIQFGGAVGRP